MTEVQYGCRKCRYDAPPSTMGTAYVVCPMCGGEWVERWRRQFEVREPKRDDGQPVRAPDPKGREVQ